MKVLITNIEYSINQEDIDNYREDENIDDELTDEEIKEEIQNSLPFYLLVDVDPDDYDNDDYDEELCDQISDITGWCIEHFEKQIAVDFVTSVLNNFMEKDCEFWMKEFGCDFDDIVNLYGFGWSKNKKGKEEFSYISVDELTYIKTPIRTIIDKIFAAGTNVTKMRQLIFWIYEKNN